MAESEATDLISVSLIKSLENDSQSLALRNAKIFRKKLKSKSDVVIFISNYVDSYRRLLVLYDLGFTKALSDGETSQLVLSRELTSLIGNLCHYSLTAAVEFKRTLHNFAQIALRVLESGDRTESALKATVLRLLGNLCDFRETANVVSGHSTLLDKISLMINGDDNSIAKMAVRAIRLLCKHRNQTRHVVLANCAYHIGVTISQKSVDTILNDNNILCVLEQLQKNYLVPIGRQLAQSQCNAKLLEIMLAHEETDQLERWQSLILTVVRSSFELRESFGTDAIRLAAGEAKTRSSICTFLCYFAKDAWSRAALREEGALAVIMERLATITSLKEQLDIVSSLKLFIHDSVGLEFVCQRRELVDLCLQLMKEYFDQTSIECSVDMPSEDQIEIAARGEIEIGTRPELFDGRVTRPYGLFPRSSPPWCSSPLSISPISLSPATSPSRSNEDSDNSSHIANFVEDIESQVDDQYTLRTKIIADCIAIFSWVTQLENSMGFLVEDIVLGSLVRYLSDGPPPLERLLHVLKRIVRARVYLSKLIGLRFPLIVIELLVRRKCNQKRFAPNCDVCSSRARLGCEILAEMIAQCDSAFGFGIFCEICLGNDENALSAIMQGMIMMRHVDRRSRFYSRFRPIATLLDYLRERLVYGSHEEIMSSKIVIDIVLALSTLIPKRHFGKLVGRSQPSHEISEADCSLRPPRIEEPQIIFKKSNGEQLIAIKKTDLQSTYGYFHGMIGHDFVENQEKCSVFVVDTEKEQCDSTDFLRFIHYLSGCRGKRCVEVYDGRICATLLHLSDKYLCTELSEELLRTNGPARRFIDGSNLSEFLPVILSSWIFRDRFGSFISLIFLKFTDDAQKRHVLAQLVGNRAVVDDFLIILSEFLNRAVECSRTCTMLPAWDLI